MAADELVETAAGDEFQGEPGVAVVLADLEDADDVGMIESGDEFGLAAEAFQGIADRRVRPARIIFRATRRLS